MIRNILEVVTGPVTDLISEFVEDPDERARLEAQFQLALLQQETTLVNATRDIVVAEAQSESWIARNWRPITALTFTAILANNYILVPWLRAFGIETIAVLDMPPELFTLLTVMIGGYVVGRSLEKTNSGINIGGGNGRE